MEANLNGWLRRTHLIGILILMGIGAVIGVYSWASSIGTTAEKEAKAYTDACVRRIETKVDSLTVKVDGMNGDFRELRGEVRTALRALEEKQ